MDDQTQQQNQQGAGQDQQSAAGQTADQVDEVQQTAMQAGGSGAPESAPMPTSQPEAQSQQVESGYERIKQIEKAAESGSEGQKESAPRPQQPKQSPAGKKKKPKPISIEKKEPPLAKPKYFGYQPPPSLAGNAKYIKQNAGKGNAKDSQTWLLLFLDRLLKKEGERA